MSQNKLQYNGINRFFLYGEPARPARDDFIHLEKLDDRSRPANWHIRPHSHADLHQIFVIERGGGIAEADTRPLTLIPPCVVFIPAGVVHGFRWHHDTVGQVLTFADPILRLVSRREPLIADMVTEGCWTATGSVVRLLKFLTELELELSWCAPGHRLAIESQLANCLVEILRLHQTQTQYVGARGNAHSLLVARYREYLETRYREHPSIERSAQALGVPSARLRSACRYVAGTSPKHLLLFRLGLEAQRLMRYSNMSVSQIARYLGFEDPAYFSRYFSKLVGKSPRDFIKASAEDQGRDKN